MTLNEIVVNVGSVLVGLLVSFVIFKFITRKFRSATFIDLRITLAILAVGVIYLTRLVFIFFLL